MSVINNGFLKGSNIPKAPTKAEVEALKKKRIQEEEELKSKLNILPRDAEKYPMPEENDIKNAGAFLYTMSLLASSYDENLQAVIWKYYVDFMNCLRPTSTQSDLFELIESLTNLKDYLINSKNPLFVDPST